MAITWQGISATGYLMPLLLALAAPEVGPASRSLLHASSLTSRCGERASGSLSSPKIHKTSCSPNTAKSLVIGRPKKRTVYYRWQPANCHVGKDGFFSDLFKERVGEKAHTVFWSREGMWFWQSEKEAEMVGWKVKDKLLHFASEMVQFIFLYLWSQRSCWWALLRWAGHESRVMLRRADLCWMASGSP